MNAAESGFEKTLTFLQSEEFDKLIAITKEFWDECDYMGNPGATEKEIGKLVKRFKKLHKIPAPEGYIAFMKELNGFKYSVFEIYPCSKAIDFNKKDKRYFSIGCGNKNFLAYAPETGKYVKLERNTYAFERVTGHDIKGRPIRVRKAEKNIPIYKTAETYESFADLFKTVMMYTLPEDKLHKVYPELKG